jgi:hypothetical protein
MKTLCIVIISLLCSGILQAQYRENHETQTQSNLNVGEQQQIYKVDSRSYSTLGLNLARHSAGDTVTYNKYGDLRNDDTELNRTYPSLIAALKVTGANVFTFAIDRYLLNYDFSRVGFNSWSHNIQTGWEWDQDRFGMNFIVHPYSGSAFFNAARSSGYDFWGSAPFAALGSLEWEYFGENTLPSYNDIINTTIDGIFLGEVTYRVGSNILDDQTTGIERFFREFSVAVLSPTRAFSRFTQGKMFRVTSEEVYQTEPMNVTLSAGIHRVNTVTNFQTGLTDYMFNIMLDYGNPFEVRSRKPFDYFKVRMDFTEGISRKILDNITGYGILFGSNSHSYGGLDMLLGGFQGFNYFDNMTFELATIGFGPGIVTKLKVSQNSNLFTNLLVGVIPLAGNSTHFAITDTSTARDYNFGGGADIKLESTLQVGPWVNFTFIGYYFWIHTYVGYAGDHYIGLIKPRIEFKLFSNISVGVEHLVYYSDRYTRDFGDFHLVRTEQRVFLSLYLESFKKQKE